MNTWNDLEAARTAELKRKSLSITASTTPALVGLELVFYKVNGHDTLSWVFMVLVASCSVFRFFHVRYSRQNDQAWRKTTLVFSFLIAVFWGSFFYRTAELGRNQFFVQALVLEAALGFSATSTYSLAIDRLIYRAYLTPILISVGAIILSLTHELPDRILGFVLTVLLYSVGFKQGNLVARGWEQNLRLTLELQALIDSFPGGILVVSRGMVTRANAYFRTLYGESTALDRLLGSAEFSSHYSRFTQADQQPIQKQFDFEAVIQTRSGSRAFWFLLVRMDGNNSLPDPFIVVALDVQAKKDAEAQIESQRQKLETSAKLAALGEMAGGVAHEINNPIFIITSRVELMLRKMDKGSATEQLLRPHFNVILETCDRIAKIVRGLRIVSRSTENEAFERTSLCDIIEQTVDVCSARVAQTRISLNLGPKPADCMVEARPVQLSQVFLNLLNNAFDAIEGAPSAWIRVEIASNPDFIEVSVMDSGPGVPEKIRTRIMEPFFTTKAPGKGTGLGLSVSASIIKAHNGSLYLDETSPHTRFVVRMPRVQNQSQEHDA